MKTFEQLLQENYQKVAIENGDLDKEDYLELDEQNLQTIKKTFKEWLTQIYQDLQEPKHNPSTWEQSIRLQGKEMLIEELLISFSGKAKKEEK